MRGALAIALALLAARAQATDLECSNPRAGPLPKEAVVRFTAGADGLYEVRSGARVFASGLKCVESRLDPRLKRCMRGAVGARANAELVLRSSIQVREDGDVVHAMFAYIEISGEGPDFPREPIRFRETECTPPP